MLIESQIFKYSNVPMFQFSNVPMCFSFHSVERVSCPLVHWSIGPLVHWSTGPLHWFNVKCQKSNVNKVILLSERNSGVPPVIFVSVSCQKTVFRKVILHFWAILQKSRSESYCSPTVMTQCLSKIVFQAPGCLLVLLRFSLQQKTIFRNLTYKLFLWTISSMLG